MILPIPPFECQVCGIVRQVKIPFADPRRSYPKSFERFVLELSRSMTIRDAARHLNVGWDLVNEIQTSGLGGICVATGLARSPGPRIEYTRRRFMPG